MGYAIQGLNYLVNVVFIFGHLLPKDRQDPDFFQSVELKF